MIMTTPSISVRRLEPSEVDRIAEIDRTECVRQAYVHHDGRLRTERVDWHVPRWTHEARGEFNIDTRIDDVRDKMTAGSVVLGAFDGETLVGYIVLRARLTDSMAQLSDLFVSHDHRRHGVASRLAAKLIERARSAGARMLYVSSFPGRAAVEFYMSQGFRVAEEVHRGLFELEPEDIHMVMDLA